VSFLGPDFKTLSRTPDIRCSPDIELSLVGTCSIFWGELTLSVFSPPVLTRLQVAALAGSMMYAIARFVFVRRQIEERA
jgi:hypothetical protein